MRVVGVLLVAALMVLPVGAANRIGRSFRQAHARRQRSSAGHARCRSGRGPDLRPGAGCDHRARRRRGVPGDAVIGGRSLPAMPAPDRSAASAADGEQSAHRPTRSSRWPSRVKRASPASSTAARCTASSTRRGTTTSATEPQLDAHEVVVMLGQVLGQLVPAELAGRGHPVDDTGVFEHDQVPVHRALRQRRRDAEDVGQGERTIGAGEDRRPACGARSCSAARRGAAGCPRCRRPCCASVVHHRREPTAIGADRTASRAGA